MPYKVKDTLKPNNLKGISNDQIDQHWELYRGYVKTVNELIGEIAGAEPGSHHWAELKRRMGFELDGVLLHEHYFENLKTGTALRPRGKLIQALDSTWKALETWKEDFAHTGEIRGVGWAILYHDPGTGHLFNWLVGDHELGHPAGFTPILVMDVWEHAYMVDHGAGGRKDYIQAFLENVNWDAVERRFEESRSRTGA